MSTSQPTLPLLLDKDAAQHATAQLLDALEADTLAAELERPYNLSAAEAADVCDIVGDALADSWRVTGYHQPFGTWLQGLPPAVVAALIDTAARSIGDAWTGGEGMRVLRHALGWIASDPRIAR